MTAESCIENTTSGSSDPQHFYNFRRKFLSIYCSLYNCGKIHKVIRCRSSESLEAFLNLKFENMTKPVSQGVMVLLQCLKAMDMPSFDSKE